MHRYSPHSQYYQYLQASLYYRYPRTPSTPNTPNTPSVFLVLPHFKYSNNIYYMAEWKCVNAAADDTFLARLRVDS